MRKILISESEKQRILNQHSLQGYKTLSTLISEADRRKDIKKFGFNDELSDIFHQIDDKRSLWLANITARSFAKMKNIQGEKLKDIVKKINSNEFKEFIEDKRGDINYILDWVKSPDREEINFKEIKNLEQAMEMSRVWHETLSGDFKIQDESGEVIKTYPEGYYWIDLKTNCSREEGAAMGHCGRDSVSTTLFSFRDKDKEPHVTIGYDGKNLNVTQVKGKQNRRPNEKYMKYVYDFINYMIKNGAVNAFKWSYLVGGVPDLSLEEIGENFGSKIKKNTIVQTGLRAMSSEDLVSFLKDEETDESTIFSTIMGITDSKFTPEMLTVAKEKMPTNKFNSLVESLVNRETNKGSETQNLVIKLTNNFIKSVIDIVGISEFFSMLDDTYTSLQVESDNEYVIDVPNTISKLQNISFLNFKSSVSSLPEDISKLNKLSFLSLANNKKLTNVPESMCKLENLEFITIINTPVSLPDCIENNPEIFIQR